MKDEQCSVMTVDRGLAIVAGQYDPCIDNEVTAYFNQPDVQRAMHANQSANTLPYAWAGCSSILNYSRWKGVPATGAFFQLLLLISKTRCTPEMVEAFFWLPSSQRAEMRLSLLVMACWQWAAS